VRIVIAGPPKAGNVWLKCIVANMFNLRQLTSKETPARPQLDLFRAWAQANKFPDGTVFHQHYDYSDELADLIAAVPAQIVTIVRDPYDAFVSSYYNIQKHKDDGLRQGRRTDVMLGKPLSDPDVLAFLRSGGFRNNMLRAKAWMESGRTHVVRYEGLHADPVAELTRLADAIQPVPREAIERAVDACSADTMRAQGGARASHVRAAKVGDSKEKLGPEHLQIFREMHGDLIRSLGYEVR
jgi:hypothetical protein